MWKNLLVASAATLAFAAPASAAVILVSGIGSSANIASNNDFRSDLSSLGLTRYTSNYQSAAIVGKPALISIYRVASEGTYNDTLQADGSGPIVKPGPSPKSGWTPDDLVAQFTYSGDLSGIISFKSNNKGPVLTFNNPQVGIFLPKGFTGTTYQTNQLFVGLDDSTPHRDNDYDDYIIRISAVPEPTTWLTLIAGFGIIGFQLRSRRQRPQSVVS